MNILIIFLLTFLHTINCIKISLIYKILVNDEIIFKKINLNWLSISEKNLKN
jgi:hypothetical protein